MAIKIIKEKDILVTQEEYYTYLAEYKEAMAYYAGPPISFENWLKQRFKIIKVLTGV